MRNYVALSGELDLAAAPELKMRLDSLDGDILIDCGGLTFIDGSGLRPLLSAHRRCRARDARLILINAPLCLTRLLILTGLEAVFDVQTEASCGDVSHGRRALVDSASGEECVPIREQKRSAGGAPGAPRFRYEQGRGSKRGRELVSDVMSEVARIFQQQRQQSEAQWSGGGAQASTDDLRVAFQPYRDFFQRLLHV